MDDLKEHGVDDQPKSLRDEIAEAIASTTSRGTIEGEHKLMADAVMQLLMERGHYLPGAPPAQRILDDAKSFAERLTLSNLTCRILNMLAWSNVETPETRPARKWLDSYLEGKGHGPIGQPMLWPTLLPGLCSLLRQWGFMPIRHDIAGREYVARQLPNPTLQ